MNDTKNAPVSDFITLKRNARLKAIAEDAPSKLRLFERVYGGKTAPRNAIKAFCNECMGFDVDGIRKCSAPACPLYEYRPYRNAV